MLVSQILPSFEGEKKRKENARGNFENTHWLLDDTIAIAIMIKQLLIFFEDDAKKNLTIIKKKILYRKILEILIPELKCIYKLMRKRIPATSSTAIL